MEIMEEHNTENKSVTELPDLIELKKERERRRIGEIPASLVAWGWVVIAVIAICLTAGYFVWRSLE